MKVFLKVLKGIVTVFLVIVLLLVIFQKVTNNKIAVGNIYIFEVASASMAPEYKVGDVIKFKDVTGKVLSIGIKTTKLEDVNTFNIVSISNRNIEQVEVVSNLINIDVPLPYELNIEGAEKVLNQMVQSIKKLNKVNNAEYRGVNNLADSSIKYQIKVYTDPTNKVQIRRDSLREILLVLEDNNIAVPYNQLDIHNKD